MRSKQNSQKKTFVGKTEGVRWSLKKRKRQILNSCMTLGFVLSFSVVNPCFSFAADAVPADAVPQDAFVEEGDAIHTYSTNTLDVEMRTSFVRESYRTYSIGRDATVNIYGGDTYIARVRSGGGLSHIYGSINAPGVNVFLQNSSGITFYGSSQVNVGSLVATTAGQIDFNEDEETDDYTLSNFGDASVINEGEIIVSEGGFAVLAAPYVENTGVIKADLGRIDLASTTAMTIDLRGDGLITYTPAEEELAKVGIKNTGTLQAKSGVVNITATAASTLIDSVVNLDGVIDADSFGEGQDGGTVLVSSLKDVNSDGLEIKAGGGFSGKGGSVSISAENNLNLNDVDINAVGGSAGNGGSIELSADADSNITSAEFDTSGGADGNAGDITISAVGTNSLGSSSKINAAGGSGSGNGGTVSISGSHVSYNASTDASAANGDAGTLAITSSALNIKNGGAGTGTDILFEQDLEFASANGTNIALEATSGLITLANLADNKLSGGAGNIKLTASDSENGGVVFEDANDVIATTSGNINIAAGAAGINIGGLQTGGASEEKPGSIVLSTQNGSDITTAGLMVKGSIAAESGDALISGSIEVESSGDISVNGDVVIDVAAEAADNASASAEADFIADGSVTISGDANISAVANGGASGESQATLSIDAGDDVLTEGSMLVSADAVSQSSSESEAVLTVKAGGNVDIAETIASVADADASIEVADATTEINAGNDIYLYSSFPDPKAAANAALVQQRFSGVDVDGDDTATLILTAGGDIRFFDENGFDQDGINRTTGTTFDPDGFDVDGNPASNPNTDPDSGPPPSSGESSGGNGDVALISSQTDGDVPDLGERKSSPDLVGGLEPAGGDGDVCNHMQCEEKG